MNIKKMACFATLMSIFLLTACGQTNEKELDKLVEESIVSKQLDIESAKDTFQPSASGVSNEAVTVSYKGEDFRKSVFAVGGDKIYICGIKSDGQYFLGCMNKEEDLFYEFSIEIPENMRAFNMTVDNQNRCHILWMSIEKITLDNQCFDRITYEQSYITIMNAKGETETQIDVTPIFMKEQRRPFCFIIDREGNYYFENGKEIVKLLSDGSMVSNIVCPGQIDGIGIGRTGVVYCTYENEDRKDMLGKLDQDVFVSCEVSLPDNNAIYANISPGTDSEALLYNKDGGVYVYDDVSNVIELRISQGDLPIYGEEVVGYGFLEDGRLCLLTQNGETVFYYIPAGM
ncbi:MAG TPA: hypothetical protein VJY54_11890 [Lachnospiraceae bacterium]|nr:hypothetical protein [Lachnospiraceae bacterium]